MPDWSDRLDWADGLDCFDGFNWLDWLYGADFLYSGRFLPEFPHHVAISSCERERMLVIKVPSE